MESCHMWFEYFFPYHFLLNASYLSIEDSANTCFLMKLAERTLIMLLYTLEVISPFLHTWAHRHLWLNCVSVIDREMRVMPSFPTELWLSLDSNLQSPSEHIIYITPLLPSKYSLLYCLYVFIPLLYDCTVASSQSPRCHASESPGPFSPSLERQESRPLINSDN